MKTFLRSFAFIVAFVAVALGATAQVTTASISGLVTDTQKETMPGATVKATHLPSGTVYMVATQTNGRFNINGMRVGGPYTIEVSFVGFVPEKIEGVSLVLGEDRNFNVVLKENTQDLGEVVVVGTRNPIISANRTGAQEVITRDKIDRMPAINRSIDDFTRLTPMSNGNSFAGASYRFNNVTVDGASFNNSYGLASKLGAGDLQPISLEAIDQIQVMIAPYDVRNGAFVGAGINTVTKSGTNQWVGSVYWYTKSPSLEGRRQKDVTVDKGDFQENHYGLSIGGPIIKNKLFFFLNGELDRLSTPISYRPRPDKNTPVEGDYSFADQQTLQELADFLMENFNYTPGSYNVENTPVEADRLTARLDWNINTKNTLSLKYFYLKSFETNNPSTSGALPGGRGPNANAIPFSSSYYRQNNNFNIFIADLNTTISSNMSNALTVGYSALRDFRDMDGGFFPEVNIGQGNAVSPAQSTAFTTFGTEANSYNNLLYSDIYQIQDNFTWTVGDHQLVFGTQSDYRSFKNGFANSFAGQYQYQSIEDFYADVLAHKQWIASGANPADRPLTNAIYYKQIYNATDSDAFPYAKTSVLTLGFYVQDRWTITPNFNLTLGLRADIPIFTSKLDHNPVFDGVIFRDGRTIDTAKLPNTNVMLSPRVGFNWDVKGDHTLQVRGGTGLFAGTPPYVWIGNQAGNNGLLFGQVETGYAFSGEVNAPKPANGQPAKASIAITDPELKYPQIWKTDLAVDYRFGKGWIATVELLYNKDVHALYHTDINHPNYDRSWVTSLGGADNRPYLIKNKLNSEAYDVILLTNTNKGYSFYTTLQLQKDFLTGPLKGLYLNGSYTFGVSKSVTDGSSSVASSAYKYRPAVNPDADELGYSAGSFPDRILLQASYRIEYAKSMATSIGVVYQRFMPFRYSYTYNGDVNNDSYSYNDLIYVPEKMSDIRIVPAAGDQRSELAIWHDIYSFIKQDPYLRYHRGEYAERNGGRAPYVNQVDLNFAQDFFLETSSGQRNTIRVSLDISNFLNLLNKNWGVRQSTPSGWNQQYQFLQMTEKPSAANNYTPGFTMPEKNGAVPTSTFEDYISPSSRWAMQIGVKYMFN